MPLGTQIDLGPGNFVLDENPALPPEKGNNPQFSAMTIVATRLDGSRCHLVRK